MFYSAYTKDELSKLSRDDLIYVIGIYYQDTWVKLPRCKVCGGFLLEDSLYGCCDECGRFYKLYVSNNLKEWYDDETCM